MVKNPTYSDPLDTVCCYLTVTSPSAIGRLAKFAFLIQRGSIAKRSGGAATGLASSSYLAQFCGTQRIPSSHLTHDIAERRWFLVRPSLRERFKPLSAATTKCSGYCGMALSYSRTSVDISPMFPNACAANMRTFSQGS